MRILIIAAAAAALVGCATQQEIQNAQEMTDREPRAAFQTSRSTDEVLDCVMTGVRAVSKSGHAVSSRIEGDGHVVWVTALANPVLSVVIQPAGDGASVEYRSRFKAGSGNYTAAILSCR